MVGFEEVSPGEVEWMSSVERVSVGGGAQVDVVEVVASEVLLSTKEVKAYYSPVICKYFLRN